MVWVLKWNYPSDGESNATIWQTELDALRQGCAEVQEVIDQDWDMGDVDQASEAQYVNNLISAGQYENALQYWNQCDINTDSEFCQHWYVEEQQILDHTHVASPTIFAPDYFTALLDDDDDDDDDDEDEAVPATKPSPYVALHPGTVCRKCHTPNEFAYADRPDGTHVCRQCQAFQSIFGS